MENESANVCQPGKIVLLGNTELERGFLGRGADCIEAQLIAV